MAHRSTAASRTIMVALPQATPVAMQLVTLEATGEMTEADMLAAVMAAAAMVAVSVVIDHVQGFLPPASRVAVQPNSAGGWPSIVSALATVPT